MIGIVITSPEVQCVKDTADVFQMQTVSTSGTKAFQVYPPPPHPVTPRTGALCCFVSGVVRPSVHARVSDGEALQEDFLWAATSSRDGGEVTVVCVCVWTRYSAPPAPDSRQGLGLSQ